MNCPECGCGYSLVVDCRTTGIAKRRRRKCSGCGHTFTTYEMFSEDYKKMTIAREYFLKTIKAMEENDENRDY